jgi:hypothetical protein
MVCMVLLTFAAQEQADAFYADFNAVPFSSLEPDVLCRCVCWVAGWAGHVLWRLQARAAAAAGSARTGSRQQPSTTRSLSTRPNMAVLCAVIIALIIAIITVAKAQARVCARRGGAVVPWPAACSDAAGRCRSRSAACSRGTAPSAALSGGAGC